jgi:hypothetical protein
MGRTVVMSMTKWWLCILVAMQSVMAIADTNDTDLLAKYRKIYDNAIAGYETEYRIAMQVWPIDYINSLKALQIEHQTSGNLDGWELVNKELIRFRAEPTLDDAKLPDAELQALQESFRKRRTTARTDRITKRDALTKKYASRLAVLQREWTQRGKFDAAFAVRDEIKRARGNQASSQEESKEVDDADKPAGPPETPPPPDTVTLKDGTRVTRPGAPAPTRELRVQFNDKRLFTTSRSPQTPLIDATLWDFADSEQSGMRHARVAVRTTHSGNPKDNLRLQTQYYSKPSGASQTPRLVTTKWTPIPLLEKRPVFVDLAPVPNAEFSYTVKHRRARNTNYKFYGYVVTLLGPDHAVLYEAATASALGKLAAGSASSSTGAVPHLKGRPKRVKRGGQ